MRDWIAGAIGLLGALLVLGGAATILSRAWFNTGRQLGVVRPCDAKVVARCVLGSIKEVVQWAFVEQDTPPVEMTQIGREMIAFTLKGCLVDGGR